MISNINIKKDILADEKYKFLFSVEEVNRLVLSGMTFRDAYRKVGMDIENGQFNPPAAVVHTHEGSAGNLKNAEIKAAMEKLITSFPFHKVNAALQSLTG